MADQPAGYQASLIGLSARRCNASRARRRPRGRLTVSGDQCKVILLHVLNLSSSRQLPQGTLQLARTAGAQAKLHHELAQSKRPVRILFEDFQDVMGGRKFAHQVLKMIVPLWVRPTRVSRILVAAKQVAIPQQGSVDCMHHANIQTSRNWTHEFLSLCLSTACTAPLRPEVSISDTVHGGFEVGNCID